MKTREKKVGSLTNLLKKYNYDVITVYKKSGIPLNRIENCKMIMLKNLNPSTI